MLGIAIAGLGTVGSALVRQIRCNASLIEERAGMPVVVRAVSARDRARQRDCDLSDIPWVDNPKELVSVPGVDAVVELIGGSDGVSYELAEAALSSAKHFVTANKALIAKHGPSLALLAESQGVQLSFEASVAGGVPVIKALREGVSGDNVDLVCGILNGTCNYILTRMRAEKLSFSAVLSDAQKLGYAESDPAADIDGHDTANKLAILAALAFGVKPDISSIRVEGIREIALSDLLFAEELGYRIKLLGMARQTADGIEQSVSPTLVSEKSPLAHVNGPLNSVLIKGRRVGPLIFQGYGAGGEPTANAVVSDILDIARGRKGAAFSLPAAKLVSLRRGPLPQMRYYMRLQVQDRPGVVADIGGIMRDENLSFESLIQRGKSPMEAVSVFVTTHHGDFEAMRRAVNKISKVPTVMERPCLIPIEDDPQ